MYTSSSLSPLLLSLPEVSASNSSPSLPAKQSSSYLRRSCNVYIATNGENRCGCNASGSGKVVVVGGGGVSLLHTGYCVVGAFSFAGFISS